MTRRNLVTAVIPAFNEGGRIGPTVRAVASYVDEVLVVDDSSRDHTAMEAEGAGAHVLHQGRTEDYIAVAKRGFAAARGLIQSDGRVLGQSAGACGQPDLGGMGANCMNQSEILSALHVNRDVLLKALDGLSDSAMQEPGAIDDWSVKDILTHLTACEAELVTWLAQAKQGKKPANTNLTPAQVDEQNAKWHKEFKNRPLDRVLADFRAVRGQTMAQIEILAEEDLNDPKRYSWLRGSPLCEWIEGDSFGHEAEHTAQVMAWRERRGY